MACRVIGTPSTAGLRRAARQSTTRTPMQFDPTSLAKYGHLTLVARTLVEGFLTGVHKSPYKGFSVEFAEHRQYYPGDEIRHIDSAQAVGKTGPVTHQGSSWRRKSALQARTCSSMPLAAWPSPARRRRQVLPPGADQQSFQYARAHRRLALLSHAAPKPRRPSARRSHDTQVRTFLKPRANSKHLLQLIPCPRTGETSRRDGTGPTPMAPGRH